MDIRKRNENVANVGASYGVALSVTAKPMEDFMEKVFEPFAREKNTTTIIRSTTTAETRRAIM